MSSRIPTRTFVFLAALFGMGVIGGFVWSLVQRRPDSTYRADLEQERFRD